MATARWGTGDFGSPGAPDTCEAPPAPASVQISEVMRNPAVVGDSEGEWFEVHNTGAADVDLRGWSLSDGASDYHVISRSIVVPAGGYTVLGRTTRNPQNGGVTTAYGYGDGFVLSNNDDRIVVRDQYDQLVDEVTWAKGDGSPRPNGASMARTDAGWCISGPQFGMGDLGTPGAANDCTPMTHPDVVISEIHLDPAAVSDTTGEWIEVTNNSAQTVDLAGWVLRDDDADSHWINPRSGSLLVARGESVVLGRDLAREVNGDTPVDYSYNASFPLSDTEDEITLLDNHLVWVDRVTWTANRPLPASVGVSASLRDLAADNSDPANWCASITTYGSLGEHGTPGRPNVCEEVATGEPPTTTTTTTTTEPAPTTTTTTTTTTTAAPAPTTTSTTTTSTTTTTTTLAPTTTTTSTTTTTLPPTATTTTTTLPPTTTTTTTTPPPPPVRPLSAGYGLLATAGAGCSTGLSLTGSGIRVEGGIRSNTSVTVQASSTTINGKISYATTKNVGSNVVAASIVQEPSPVTSGLVWAITDFAPGGVFSLRPDYVAHIGDWTVDGHGATPGIHFVTGNVVIADSAPDLVGVTIVATGTVTISGGSVLSPASTDLPTVMAMGGTCKKAAINLSGGTVTWSGVLAGPNGIVQVNANTLRGGSVIAAAIQMSGSDIVIS